jgi:integrase
MRWEEIDLGRDEWCVPKERMKRKRPHVVPLSRQARALFKELHEETGDREFVFYSPKSRSKHISNGAILMALRRLGYQGRHCGHGYRTLASTILNERGYDADVIEAQLSHEDTDDVRSAYNRAQYLLERKKLMQDYADILEKMRSEAGDKVIKFKRDSSRAEA